jgi:ketosteroid isomerase-like protein
MRFWGLLLCAAAAAAAACQRPTAEPAEFDRAAVEEEVRQAADAYFAAQNSNDADTVFETYLHSEDFAYLGVTGVMIGWDRFSATVANWFRNRPDIAFEHETVLVQPLNPTVAVATVRASSTEQEFLLFTQVYVKNDAGRWVVAHEHVSWPEAPAPRRHPGMEEVAPPPEGMEP